MDIRKISVGPDYKSGAMHYIVGQEILNGKYFIHLIQQDSGTQAIKIWIQRKKSISNKSKKFSHRMGKIIRFLVMFEFIHNY